MDLNLNHNFEKFVRLSLQLSTFNFQVIGGSTDFCFEKVGH